MIWVAIDRGKFFILLLSLSSLASNPNQGLRLADKRSLPCPNRSQWIAVRDELYEEIMNNAWNKEEKFFGQSYEDTNVLDSAVLIMPLVFFMHASDPRFVSTLKQILKTPARGGLTSNVRFLSPPLPFTTAHRKLMVVCAWTHFRISCIVMTLERLKMEWEVKKAHSVCVRYGV